jgi:hypothetical protein
MTVGLMKISFIKNHDNLTIDFMYVGGTKWTVRYNTTAQFNTQKQI